MALSTKGKIIFVEYTRKKHYSLLYVL